MVDKSNKPTKINYSSRNVVGSLVKAVTLSTDPAHILGFSASLINTSRSALIYKLEQHVPDDAALPNLFNAILKVTATKWKDVDLIDDESVLILNKRIDSIFTSVSLARYDLETYRDILFCDTLGQRWKQANEIYLMTPTAWSLSNEIISDINRQLMEIITRHDLMEFPKGESFNLDDHGTDVGTIAAMLAQQRKRGQEDSQ